ncbi:hypothetical protein PR202_ga15505 [Eleusine coracana subsp. coracana]|uniref:Uncharacterized protein n=1 Tax=Eleusine coracana subsp. coracana TaxID=191504 RepID=A0AAV5CJ58_ELECO|nr:hypothetical protein PR202_ga15505 [Eleusine coracana subsp. coracana]
MQMALPVNMKLIKDELELINAFLKEIDMKGCNGEVIETWIRQVRRVAYDMEDIVDQFMYIVEIHGNENRTFDAVSMDSAELSMELKKVVDKKRYLIILDDVWTAEVLINISEVLVDNGLGSRVIITTRIEEVASVAEEGMSTVETEPANLPEQCSTNPQWHILGGSGWVFI